MLNKWLVNSAVMAIAICSAPAFANLLPEEWQGSDSGVLSISGEGQYFMQSYNLLDVNEGVVDNFQDFFPGNVAEQYPLFNHQTNDSWGYRANIGYLFPSHEWDIRGTYTQILDSSSTQSFSIAAADFSGSVDQKNIYDFQAADITVGFFFPFADWFDLRVGAGIAFADIKQKSTNTAVAGSEVIKSTFENKYLGVGPKVALEAAFAISQNLSVVGDLGLFGLWGPSKATTSLLEASPVGLDNEFPNVEDNSQFSPGVDGKLALHYAHLMTDNSRWNIELGYRGAYYSDALQNEADGFDVLRNDISHSVDFSNTDYYNSGPYLSIGFEFM